ncbi:AAA family ATPase [Humibacillus xanthopallidus]|uniref:AAA family ATPase n=1 Tax=Humibacillus xanthopallidus TaxID=412689 RepID=UPI00385099F8
MWIERLQVEEGFLDGLDITFSPGLNVIIGARGVGKTSILELIRYALRLQHVDDRRAAAATQHAEAILAGGQVLVTFVDAGQRLTLRRSAADQAVNDLVPSTNPPLMLGQNELEGIGLDPGSRLRLIDAHAGIEPRTVESVIDRYGAQAQSLTAQMRGISQQRENLRQQELVRPAIEKDLSSARAEEASLIGSAGAEAAALRQQLASATAHAVQLTRHVVGLEESHEILQELLSSSHASAESLEASRATLTSHGGRSEMYSTRVAGVVEQQQHVSRSLAKLKEDIEADISAARAEIARLNDQMRPVRRNFDEYEVGAAAAAQRTAQLEQQLKAIEESVDRARALDSQLSQIVAQRKAIMDLIDQSREQLWSLRLAAAERLNSQFRPRIRIEMEHYGNRSGYIGALASALRGSGLQYNQLAEWLADRLSPQELVSAVEDGDAARLAIMGEITSSRVEKLATFLADAESLGRVLTAKLDDLVHFSLLVGRDYRDSEQLSTGQRCAVVLPLLLSDAQRTLLLDQPEDHLDNAYLVDNTVRTLVARSDRGAQTIVATHNANIPVLGDAGLVLVLESDGRRGYVRHGGPLLDANVVRAISELMEGGADAFAKRVQFYGAGERRA